MTEQEKPKAGSWKDLFWRSGEEAAPTPAAAPAATGSLPVPASIPGRPTPAFIPGRAAPPPAAVDEGMVKRILAELEAEAPEGYKDFVGDLATLADTIHDEGLLYKAALKLAGKQGHTPTGLGLDYEKCLRLLDNQGQMFEDSVQEQITAKVGGRQAEVARLDGEIARLTEQLQQLQGQRNAEASAIETDTARIETTKLMFQGAFAAVHARLNDQKNKLAAYGSRS